MMGVTGLELAETDTYAARGLDSLAQRRLALLGDLILGAAINVTGVKDPAEVERVHFLDSLSLLDLECVVSAEKIVDIGSGAGLPALVLALALPDADVVAVESQGKKCVHIARVAATLSLKNIEVQCQRAEEYGHRDGREAYDVAVSRAVASLPVVAEYSFPLLRKGGTMVAMKSTISDQERIQAQRAVAILGADLLERVRLWPFPGAKNRWVYFSRKVHPTPEEYPRRAGTPVKRPLGC